MGNGMNKQKFLTRFILQRAARGESNPLIAKNTHPQQNKKLKQAAVLMPLVQRENGLHMLFTQRALHLKHHPGQVSFPGGKYETTDPSLSFTALRETEEEVGINRNNIQLLGQLPSLTTTSGYHVTPFIGFVKYIQPLIIDPNEVKVCFEAPFSFLLNSQNFSKQHLTANKKRHFTYCCAYQNHLIWGATALMLINLQRHLG